MGLLDFERKLQSLSAGYLLEFFIRIPKKILKILNLVANHLDPFFAEELGHCRRRLKMVLPCQQAGTINDSMRGNIAWTAIHGPSNHARTRFGAEIGRDRSIRGDASPRNKFHHVINVLKKVICLFLFDGWHIRNESTS